MGSAPSRLDPAVAGTWYPSDPVALRERVDALLHEHRDRRQGAPRALIAPHAGYAYSGPVAASAFGPVLGGRPRRVVLIGPSHHVAFEGAFVPAAAAYRTPLGDVPVDREALAGITDGHHVLATDRPFEREHSLEAELPFLQRVLADGWSLIPILTGGGVSRASLDRLVEILADLRSADTLFVVSSDFTHYGERFGYVPFTDDVPERIRRLDLGAVEHIVAGDAEGFREYCRRTGATICGRDAIEVLLRVLPGPATLAGYECSGNLTGTWDLSVSYAGLTLSAPHGADA